MHEEMITKGLTVQVVDTPEEAPMYEDSWKMLRIEKAIITAKGTVNGNPTVDLQMIDADGKQHLVMATGGVLEMLVGAVKGVKGR